MTKPVTSQRAWLELSFPADLDIDAVVQLMWSLATRSRSGWLGSRRAVVFELDVSGGVWQWRVGMPSADVAEFRTRMTSLLPQVGVEPVERPRVLLDHAVELRMRSARRSTHTDAPGLAAIAVLGSFGGLGAGERLVLQWIVGPWMARAPVPNPSDRRVEPTPWRLWQSGVELDGEATAALRRKQVSPLFGATLRIGVVAGDRVRRQQLLRRVFGALQVVREPGVGFVRRIASSSGVVRRIDRCATLVVEWPVVVNASELGNLIGWPIGGPSLNGVRYRTSRLLPAQPRVLVPIVTPDVDRSLFGDVRRVAAATFPGQSGSLVQRATDALRHTHVLGPTGSGKSHLLTQMITQDIAAGRGVVVIEPKSDLIRSILERIPPDRTNDVVVLDGSGSARPVGVNPLAGVHPANRELVVDQVLGLLHSLWRESWGPRTNDVLHAGLLTIAASEFPSLVALPTLFTNETFRRRAVAEALRTDPWGLDAFWAWFEHLSVEQRAQVLGPVMSKLRAFLLRPSMRAILGQTEPAFSVRQVFTQRKVLLVNLAKGAVGPEASALLGSIVMAQLWQAVQSRAQIDPERRHPVMVYVDEFQDYTHGTTDFADVLAQARGLGVGVTMSHQHLAQLNNPLRDAVLANAQSKIVFRLDHRDARTMADGHSELTADDITGLGRFELYASLLTDGTVSQYASGRTTELDAPFSRPEAIRARSADRYGVNASDTDAALRHLTGTTDTLGDVDDPGDEFGVRRLP